MAASSSFVDSLHDATHRIPGIPAHRETPSGHHGTSLSKDDRRRSSNHAGRHSGRRTSNHTAARPPRMLVGWQRRIAALFGQHID